MTTTTKTRLISTDPVAAIPGSTSTYVAIDGPDGSDNVIGRVDRVRVRGNTGRRAWRFRAVSFEDERAVTMWSTQTDAVAAVVKAYQGVRS